MIMVNFFIVCLLVIPWVFIPINGLTDQLRIPKAVFFDLTCLGLLFFLIKDGVRAKFQNKYLAWLSAWIFFVIFMNWSLPLLMSRNGQVVYNFGTIESCVHTILAIIGFVVISSNLMRDDYIRIAKAICLSSVLVTVYAYMQKFGFDPLGSVIVYKERELNHFSALLDHPDLCGNYLALCIPFFLFFKQKRFIFGLFFVLSGLLLTKSSISFVAAFLAIICSLFFNNRDTLKSVLIILSLFVLLIVAILISPKINKFSGGFSGRMYAWQQTMPHLKENPLFGQGLGVYKTFDVHFGNYWYDAGVRHGERTNWVYAHNDWIERWAEIGLFGLFLCVMMVGNSFLKFNYAIENRLGFSYLCSFIAFLVIMCGSFPMEIAPLALMGMISFSGVERL